MEKVNNILEWSPIFQVRRNHGLEHATLNLLAKEFPNQSFAGHSDNKGIWIVGDVSTDKLLETVQQALKRMKAGESELALHPNCGTNFVTAGIVAGTAAWLGSLGNAKSFSKKIDRWALMVMLVTGTLIATQPWGKKVQARVTTTGKMDGMAIKQIVRYERKGPVLHRILTTEILELAEH